MQEALHFGLQKGMPDPVCLEMCAKNYTPSDFVSFGTAHVLRDLLRLPENVNALKIQRR